MAAICHRVVLSVSFAVFTLAGLLSSAVGENTAQPARIPAIDEVVRKYVEDNTISGAVTLVAQGGTVVHQSAIGKADLASGRSMQPDTMFRIASMTKPITATALMILVEEGKVSLDDPVSKYIPEFADVRLEGQPLEQPMTIRQILTHTAGLNGSQRNVGDLENTAKMVAKRPLRYVPGTRWEYSPGISIAGRVVEVASGQKFGDFLSERIFQPLGMNDTTFNPTDAQQPRLATLYALGEDKQTLSPAESWIGNPAEDAYPNPSGGLISTAGDLFRFYQMVLNGGYLEDARILKRETVEQMTSLQTGDIVTGFTPGNGWGLGWCVVRQPQGVTEALSPGSFGHGGAFGTQGWIDPERKRIYVLLIQRSNIGNSDGSRLRQDFQNAAAAHLNP